MNVCLYREVQRSYPNGVESILAGKTCLKTILCCPFKLLSGSVRHFCSAIVFSSSFIKLQLCGKWYVMPGTVSCIKPQADQLHLGIIPHSQMQNWQAWGEKNLSAPFWANMGIGFSPVSLTKRNLVLTTFCCLWHILWLFWKLSLERPESFCFPVCLKFRLLDFTFVIWASITFCVHELTFFFGGKLWVSVEPCFRIYGFL